MTINGDGSEESKKAKRGRPPNPAYAAAADIAWRNHLSGMNMLAASRAAVEVLGNFDSVDMRGLVEGGRGPQPNDGLFPNREEVKAGRCTNRTLSEFTSRPQRPAKWADSNNDTFPRYYLASDDSVVQQVYAIVRKRKKASR